MLRYLVVTTNPDMARQAESVSHMLGIAGEVRILDVGRSALITPAVYQAVREGPSVVISRGSLATVLENTFPDLPPLVRVRLSIKETTDLLQKAIALSGREQPRIAFCCAASMAPSLGSLPELFHVKISLLTQTDDELLHFGAAGNVNGFIRSRLQEFQRDGTDVVIGGINVCALAGEMGIKNVYMAGTEDSMYEAFRGGQPLYSLFLSIGGAERICSLVPVSEGGQVHAAILSVQSQEAQEQDTKNANSESRRRGLFSPDHFSDFPDGDAGFAELLRRARTYAHTAAPVFLHGACGTEYRRLAGCLHNESPRSDGPFVRVDCRLLDEAQQRALFGSAGLTATGEVHSENPVLLANHGTLTLENIDALSLSAQGMLLAFLETRALYRGGVQPIVLDVRLLTTSEADLAALVREGRFLPLLYYRLTTLQLRVPPLSARRGQLEAYTQRLLREACARYTRYLELTQEARQEIARYPWPGNLTQLAGFCEHLVITATRRSISGTAVADALQEMYHDGGTSAAPGGAVQEAQVTQLLALLEKHGGSRQAVADELHISRSSLWRLMKKYGVQNDFSRTGPAG